MWAQWVAVLIAFVLALFYPTECGRMDLSGTIVPLDAVPKVSRLLSNPAATAAMQPLVVLYESLECAEPVVRQEEGVSCYRITERLTLLGFEFNSSVIVRRSEPKREGSTWFYRNHVVGEGDYGEWVVSVKQEFTVNEETGKWTDVFLSVTAPRCMCGYVLRTAKAAHGLLWDAILDKL